MALEIAPEKVAHVIIKAREYDVKVGAWNDSPEEGDADEDPSAILEDFANDPTRAELTGSSSAERRRAGPPRGTRRGSGAARSSPRSSTRLSRPPRART